MKKIISYNLNGIRAALKKDFTGWLQEKNPDMICIQETKAQPSDIDVDAFKEMGYESLLHSAERKGYSGVAIFTKHKPDHVEIGMGNPKYDAEGRVIRADFGDISLMSVYVPSGTMGDIRQDFKMEFLADFQEYITGLRKSRSKLIICGDFNICRLWIDIHAPEKHEDMSGFLPEERDWFAGFIETGIVDSFREFNDQPMNYSWWSYRAGARNKNLGWRIDYNLVTENLKPILKNAAIMPDAMHSDHCPVMVELDF